MRGGAEGWYIGTQGDGCQVVSGVRVSGLLVIVVRLVIRESLVVLGQLGGELETNISISPLALEPSLTGWQLTLGLLSQSSAASTLSGLALFGSPMRLWSEMSTVETLSIGDHFSLRMSRQMLPCRSTFGW